jgi:hypothetical protein
MRFLNFPVRLVPAALALVVINAGCRPKTKVLKSPPHYNFSTAYTDKLDLKLKEISGITWDAKNNAFLAKPSLSAPNIFLVIKVIMKMWPS